MALNTIQGFFYITFLHESYKRLRLFSGAFSRFLHSLFF